MRDFSLSNLSIKQGERLVVGALLALVFFFAWLAFIFFRQPSAYMEIPLGSTIQSLERLGFKCKKPLSAEGASKLIVCDVDVPWRDELGIKITHRAVVFNDGDLFKIMAHGEMDDDGARLIDLHEELSEKYDLTSPEYAWGVSERVPTYQFKGDWALIVSRVDMNYNYTLFSPYARVYATKKDRGLRKLPESAIKK